jgi:hypothetical protein
MADRPMAAGATPGLALAQQMTQSASLKGWWAQGGFKEWFLNERALDEQVDWLMHLALRAAEDVLKNEDPKSAGARVAMVKTIAEMAGRLAKSSGGAGGDKKAKAIGAMSKDEITKLLGDQGIRVEQVVTLPVDGKE